MERESVRSSNIVSVGYDANSQTLEIEFKGGTVYQYYDVPENEYENLMSASSQGVYFSTNIKENYNYQKL
ncbi:KTSC domain-containing protein [Luteirhabdus pelagi]|uniref:KTSC domain-containing protein n=1 Tax=Luteirhabdus pelagi TaxID=2792783 RepID=UPI0019398780|nr:KTSC domain-containing protein [Luteirhabdus pelagi]